MVYVIGTTKSPVDIFTLQANGADPAVVMDNWLHIMMYLGSSVGYRLLGGGGFLSRPVGMCLSRHSISVGLICGSQHTTNYT